MSDSSKNQPVSNKVIEVLVNSIFRKNGITQDELKANISDEQKEMIREMVTDLKAQAEQFKEKHEEG